jgi:hypothetical protein
VALKNCGKKTQFFRLTKIALKKLQIVHFKKLEKKVMGNQVFPLVLLSVQTNWLVTLLDELC